MEDSSISSTSILLNCGVGNSIIKNIGLREVVIKDINWLWIKSEKKSDNVIKLFGYLRRENTI